MPDEKIWSPFPQVFLDALKLVESMPSGGPPPPELIRAAQAVQPYTDIVLRAMQLGEGTGGFLISSMSAAKDLQLPVPTPQELWQAEADLRARLLETSQEELQEAVAAIPADPEKLKLVAFLKGAIDQATGVRGSSPWIVLVLVFYVCLKINPDPVTSLGTALAVVALMQAIKPGG